MIQTTREFFETGFLHPLYLTKSRFAANLFPTRGPILFNVLLVMWCLLSCDACCHVTRVFFLLKMEPNLSF